MTEPNDSELSAYSGHGFNPAGTNDSWSNLYVHIPEGARVLDVGCSSGNFGEALERLKHCTVVGVDLDAADIAEAATKISRALVFDVTSAESLDELGTFDVIVFADVLEHLGDPRAALARIRSILNEGGFVVYSIPNMTHTSVRLDLLRGQFGYTQTGILDKTHVHFYDRAEVADVFASAGFDIVDENPVRFTYPDLLVTENLAELGLEARAGDREFFEMVERTDGGVLQFVGKAVPDAAGEPARAAQVREREFPPEEINRRIEDLHARVVAAETGQNESQVEVEAERVRADAESTRADAERSRADAAQAELDRLSGVIAELKSNPLRFAARRLRRNS